MPFMLFDVEACVLRYSSDNSLLCEAEFAYWNGGKVKNLFRNVLKFWKYYGKSRIREDWERKELKLSQFSLSSFKKFKEERNLREKKREKAISDKFWENSKIFENKKENQ